MLCATRTQHMPRSVRTAAIDGKFLCTRIASEWLPARERQGSARLGGPGRRPRPRVAHALAGKQPRQHSRRRVSNLS